MNASTAYPRQSVADRSGVNFLSSSTVSDRGYCNASASLCLPDRPFLEHRLAGGDLRGPTGVHHLIPRPGAVWQAGAGLVVSTLLAVALPAASITFWRFGLRHYGSASS